MPSTPLEFLAETASFLGLGPLEYTEGACTLFLENRPVVIRQAPFVNCLTLSAVVTDEVPEPLPSPVVDKLLEMALHPAFFHGPAIGRDAEGGMFIAYVHIPLERINTADAGDIITAFLDFVLHMDQLLNRQADPAAPSEPEIWKQDLLKV